MAPRQHKRLTKDFDKPHTTIEVSVKVKSKGEEKRDSYDIFEEDGEGLEQVRNPAYVGISSCLTHNLGDGDYIKVAVSIEVPCRPNRRSLKNTTIRAKRFVRDRIHAEFDASRKQISSL